jgi:hypothetical protein
MAPSIWVAGMRLSSSVALKGYQSGRRQLYLNDLKEKMFPMDQAQADAVSRRCSLLFSSAEALFVLVLVFVLALSFLWASIFPLTLRHTAPSST